jgi:hypothetical protein
MSSKIKISLAHALTRSVTFRCMWYLHDTLQIFVFVSPHSFVDFAIYKKVYRSLC